MFRRQARDHGVDLFLVLGMDRIKPEVRIFKERVGRIAVDPLNGLIDVMEARQIRGQGPHDIRDRGEDAIDAILALAQRRGGLPPFGNVAADHLDEMLSILVDGAGTDFDMPHVAIVCWRIGLEYRAALGAQVFPDLFRLPADRCGRQGPE